MAHLYSNFSQSVLFSGLFCLAAFCSFFCRRTLSQQLQFSPFVVVKLCLLLVCVRCIGWCLTVRQVSQRGLDFVSTRTRRQQLGQCECWLGVSSMAAPWGLTAQQVKEAVMNRVRLPSASIVCSECTHTHRQARTHAQTHTHVHTHMPVINNTTSVSKPPLPNLSLWWMPISVLNCTIR